MYRFLRKMAERIFGRKEPEPEPEVETYRPDATYSKGDVVLYNANLYRLYRAFPEITESNKG